MTNQFSGIITAAFKQLHKDAIEAILENTALTVPCLVTYEDTKVTVCPNCWPDNIGGKSSNRYRAGGPIPFTQGICPYCNGVYKLKVSSTETVYLMTIWDSKSWVIDNHTLNTAKVDVQTMSKIITYPMLKRASKIVLDTNISNLGVGEFIRVGDPQPIGFNDNNFVICSWSKI